MIGGTLIAEMTKPFLWVFWASQAQPMMEMISGPGGNNQCSAAVFDGEPHSINTYELLQTGY